MYTLFAAMLALLPWLPRKAPRYRRTSEGFVTPSREQPRIRWTSADSYTVDHDPDAPAIVVNLKNGHVRQVPLPADPILGSTILSALSEHLPQRPPAPCHAPELARDWLLALLCTALYFALIPSLFRALPWLVTKDARPLLFLALLVLGPLAAILLAGHRAPARLLHLASLTNLLSSPLLFLAPHLL